MREIIGNRKRRRRCHPMLYNIMVPKLFARDNTYASDVQFSKQNYRQYYLYRLMNHGKKTTKNKTIRIKI